MTTGPEQEMSIHQIAQEIVNTYVFKLISKSADKLEIDITDRNRLCVAFAEALQSAEQAAYERGIADAAKIAENTWDYIPQETWDEGFEPDYKLTQDTAAERIRALSRKEQK